ncbi:MAG: hemolysin III family protein [Clostridia bacterium]|nr:hemolysin III family protein [Clostridia bacterium]
MKKRYSLGEEIFNAVTHGVGGGLSIAGCTLMIILAAFTGDAMKIVCASIFGATLIILYTMSTLYHALSNPTAKKVMRIFDHCTIFMLIAGTYTPFTLVVIGGALGWTLFGILWGATVIGIVLNSLSLNKFKKLSMVLYVVMGWCVVFCVKPVIDYLGIWGSLMLLAGGIFYTGGIPFFSIKKKYFHSVWHIFVVLGSVCHIFCVMFWII